MFNLILSFFFYFYILSMNYLILIIIFLLFYILLKNKGNSIQKNSIYENSIYEHSIYENSIYENSIQENFIQNDIKKIYNSSEFITLRDSYDNWITKNQEDKKTFKRPHSKNYFNHIRNESHDFSSMLDPILKSYFLNQMKSLNIKEDQTVAGFITYTEPSAKIVISIDMKKEDLQDLYIKYVISDKKTNYVLYQNYTYYPNKIENHNYIEQNDTQDIFNDKIIAFERPTNLDGQDGFINTETFQIERELYLYEGDYKIDFQFMLAEEKNLNNILEKVNIEISNNSILNETISSNVELKKEDANIKTETKNTNNNYFAKLFLEYKLEELKNRLRLERELINKEYIINEDLIITEEQDNYNYYKLVIVMLIYIYEIYLKIKTNKEILLAPAPAPAPKTESDINETYYVQFFYNSYRIDGILNEQQLEYLKKIKTKSFLDKKELDTRDVDFDDIISKATIGDINFKEEYKKLIPTLIKALENIEKEISSINLNSITATLEFKYNFGNFIPERQYALLNNVSPSQYVIDTVHSIRDDFNKIYGKNRADLKDVEFHELMNPDLKNRLAILHKYSELYENENNKVKNEPVQKDFEEYKIIHKIKLILEHFIEQLNSGSNQYTNMEDAGKINTLNELSKLNAENYKFGDYIYIDANPDNEIFGPIESFTNNNNDEEINEKNNQKIGKVIVELNNKLKDIEKQKNKKQALKKKIPV